MSSSFGTALRVSVFGQSHGAAVGALVEGLPAGFAPDLDALRAFVARRSPGRFPWDTRRQETDAPRIVSGLNAHGATCGAPLCILVENADTRSADYGNLRFVPRPGHADYPAWMKWKGENDIFGGGHFSARVMAPLTAAGGIALQILEKAGIRIAAHLLEVDEIADAVHELQRLGFAYTVPTEDAEGVRTFTCTVCGETRTEAIPKKEKKAEPAPTPTPTPTPAPTPAPDPSPKPEPSGGSDLPLPLYIVGGVGLVAVGALVGVLISRRKGE